MTANASPRIDDTRTGPAVPGRGGLLAQAFAATGPFAAILLPAALALLVLSVSRLLLAAAHHEQVAAAGGYAVLLRAGLRLDLVVACMLVLPPAALLLFAPGRWRRATQALALLYATLACAMVAWLECATWPFLAEFGTRPNLILVQYLGSPREVLATVAQRAPFAALASLALAIAVGLAVARLMRAVLGRAAPWPLWTRALAALPFALLMALGIRGTGKNPLNQSAAAISADALVNALASNAPYSLGDALFRAWREPHIDVLYGSLPADEALARVARCGGHAGWSWRQEVPTSQPIRAVPGIPQPRNLVVILAESLGAPFVGCLGGRPLTPHLDRWARQGTLFTSLYATGTRTERGIEGVVAGFVPLPGRSALKMNRSQAGFATITAFLRQRGYATSFIYGGEGQFDNMRGFLVGNGVDRFVDLDAMPADAYRGTWGVCDGVVFDRALDILSAERQPFCSLILTTSSHPPFEFPADGLDLPEQPVATAANAIAYADHALGRFLDQAARRPWAADTVFLIVADHNMRTLGPGLVPVPAFRIPALLLGPEVPRGELATIASQIDLVPTLLPYLGVPGPSPFLGSDLLDPAFPGPGRAIMLTADSQAYLAGERVVVHQPGRPARQFRLRQGCLEEDPVADPELQADALAHALLPDLLSRAHRYAVPR